MNSTFFLLFFEFVKIGLFTFGGGLASLPFLYQILDSYNWFNLSELTQLIALSNLTPGPIGLNMATFAGFQTLGIKGAFIASFALVLPMLILTTLIYKIFNKVSNNKYIQSILYILRPTSAALILSVGIKLFYSHILKSDLTLLNIDVKALILFLFLFILTFKFNKNPLLYITISAFVGIILYYIHF